MRPRKGPKALWCVIDCTGELCNTCPNKRGAVKLMHAYNTYEPNFVPYHVAKYVLAEGAK